MACFLVPTAEAVIVTVAEKVATSKKASEKKENNTTREGHISFKRKLGWLKTMLWGGSALLAFEHVWHGEVTPWFPFLTNAANPADRAEMLGEMSTSGVAMAVLVTAVWGGMLAVSALLEKKYTKDAKEN